LGEVKEKMNNMGRKKLWKQIEPDFRNSSSREYIRKDVKAHLLECPDGLVWVDSGTWDLYLNGKLIAQRHWYGRHLKNPPFTRGPIKR